MIHRMKNNMISLMLGLMIASSCSQPVFAYQPTSDIEAHSATISEIRIDGKQNNVTPDEAAEVINALITGKIDMSHKETSINVSVNKEKSKLDILKLGYTAYQNMLDIFITLFKNSGSLLIAVALAPIYVYLKNKRTKNNKKR